MCKDNEYIYNMINEKKLEKLNLTDNIVFNNDNIDFLNIVSKNTEAFIDIAILDPPYNTKRKNLKYPDNNPTWDSDFRTRVEKIYELLKPEGFIVVTLNQIKLGEAIQIAKKIFGEKNVYLFTYNTDIGGGIKGRLQDLKSVIEFGIIGIKDKQISKFLAPTLNTEISTIPDSYKHLITFEDTETKISYSSRTLISKAQKQDISFISKHLKNIYCDTNPKGAIHIEVKKHLEIYFKKNLESYISSKNLSLYLKCLDTPVKVTIKETSDRTTTDRNKFVITLNHKFYLINLRLLIPLSTSYFILENKIYNEHKLSNYWGDISYNGIDEELPQKLNNSMKPVKLFERIISLYSPEPNNKITIFDAYSGRGTIAKAIYNLNNNQNNISYNFISCEKDPDIFKDILYRNISNLITLFFQCTFYKIENK